MAEPKGRELELIRDTFVNAYNGLHGTGYAPSATTPGDPTTDLLFIDPSTTEPLRVQQTRAVGDPENEFRHPAEVKRSMIEPLQGHLRAMDSRGFVVSLTIDRLPRAADEKGRLFGRLWSMISRELGPLGPPRSTASRLHVDRCILQDYREVAEFIADLEVCQVDGDAPTAVVWSPTAAAFIIDVATQAAASMKAKASRYGSSACDHVLLIACETLPYSGYDVRALQRAIAGGAVQSPFREVWLVSLWGQPSADRVWPA